MTKHKLFLFYLSPLSNRYNLFPIKSNEYKTVQGTVSRDLDPFLVKTNSSWLPNENAKTV